MPGGRAPAGVSGGIFSRCRINCAEFVVGEGGSNAALPNSDSILEKGRSSSRNPAIFSVKEAINAKGNFSRGNEGLAFAKWATGWVQSIRGSGSLPVLTLGQGGEWSGINCSVLSTRGSSWTPREKCRHLERALADEYSLLDKHVSGFLSKLLTGDPDSAKRAGNRLAGPDMAKPVVRFRLSAAALARVFKDGEMTSSLALVAAVAAVKSMASSEGWRGVCSCLM